MCGLMYYVIEFMAISLIIKFSRNHNTDGVCDESNGLTAVADDTHTAPHHTTVESLISINFWNCAILCYCSGWCCCWFLLLLLFSIHFLFLISFFLSFFLVNLYSSRLGWSIKLRCVHSFIVITLREFRNSP